MHHICLPKSNLRIGDHPTGIRKTKPGKAGIGPFPRRGKKNPIALTPFPTICHRYIRCIFCRPGLRLYFAVCINKVKARAHPKVYPNTARPVGGAQMSTDRNTTDTERQVSPLFRVVQVLLLATFVVAVYLPGLSMVHHRLFKSSRVERYGHVTQ